MKEEEDKEKDKEIHYCEICDIYEVFEKVEDPYNRAMGGNPWMRYLCPNCYSKIAEDI